MSILDKYLVDTCSLITETRNEYGDVEQQATTDTPCRFRQITTLTRQASGETVNSDAMAWFKSTESVDYGTIVLFDGLYWQIDRITRAKRLGSTEELFLKCDLKIIRVS